MRLMAVSSILVPDELRQLTYQGRRSRSTILSPHARMERELLYYRLKCRMSFSAIHWNRLVLRWQLTHAEMYSGVGVSAGSYNGQSTRAIDTSRRASIRPRLYSGMSINRSRMDTTFSPRSGSGNGARRYSVTRRSCRERVWCSRCR